ncbi:hypothetical protein ABZX51_004978 [Aspergillus tubingensis]
MRTRAHLQKQLLGAKQVAAAAAAAAAAATAATYSSPSLQQASKLNNHLEIHTYLQLQLTPSYRGRCQGLVTTCTTSIAKCARPPRSHVFGQLSEEKIFFSRTAVSAWQVLTY